MSSLYAPPSIRTIREDLQASVVLSGGQVVPCLIGRSNGKATIKEAFNGILGVTAAYTFTGLGAEGPITSISEVRSKANGGIVYREGTDFTFVPGTQILTFLSVNLASPYITAVNELDGTSSLTPSTTYYYVVTALKLLDNTGTVYGETVASNEISQLVSASSKTVKLTWQTVTGAESYKVYRTTTQGDYTGSALLATVSGEFTAAFEDAGAATTVGSPPGVNTFAQIIATNNGPYNLNPAEDLDITVDGGVAQTLTFNATRARRTGSGGSYPVDPAGTTVQVAIDGGETQTIVLPSGSSTLADIIAAITAHPLTGGYVDTDGGELRFSSDTEGTGSSVEIVGGTGLAHIGATSGIAQGTGNVANINTVTAAEVVSVLTAIPLVGATASLDPATGRPRVTHDTAGILSTLEFTGGTATNVGFPTSLVAGNTATAGTALRRPALNSVAVNFYVDYVYTQSQNFTVIRHTSIGQVFAEHGLGSDLAKGATLCMAGSGRGNQAALILTIAVPDDTLPSYQAALGVLETRRDLDLVVPLTVVSGIDNAVKAHVELMSDTTHQRERFGVVGTPIRTVVGDETTAGTAIYRTIALNSKRMIVAYPWPNVNTQGADGVFANEELPGWASACIVAGRTASVADRAEPITEKQVYGIESLGITPDEIEMNLLAVNGVMVIFEEEGQFRVRDGITSSTDNAVDKEFNILLVEDQLRKSLRRQFRSFRGRKLLPNILGQIKSRTSKVLGTFQKDELIVTYDPSSIVAEQDTTVLTKVIVRFRYSPVFPLRIIEFRYSFDLTPTALSA